MQEIKAWLKKLQVPQPDVVICNAGVFEFKPVLELSEEEMMTAWQSNVFGVWRTIKAATPRSKLVVISSEGAILARTPYTWPYVGTKKALEDLVACLQLEQPTLKTTIVRPGAMRTPMLDQLANLKSADPKVRFMWTVAQYCARWYSSSVDAVAAGVVEIVEEPRPPRFRNIGHNPILRLISALPEIVTSFTLRLTLAFID